MNLRAKRRDLWLTRLYYLTALGGAGFISPFLNLFYVRLGLSGTDIGLVAAIGSVVALIAAPIWTSESRKRRNPRALLQIALALMALSYLWLGQQKLFWGIALVTVIRVLVGAAISPLSDSLALSVTGATKSGFGSVRVWASMGWVVSVLSGGWLIERAGFGAGFMGVCLASLAGAMFLFPIEPRHFAKERVQGQQTARLGTVIRDVLRNRAMVGVGLMMSIIGIANSGVGQFETVYLSTLGAKESLIGVAGMASAVVEIPCMLWADRLVRRRGAHPLLLNHHGDDGLAAGNSFAVSFRAHHHGRASDWRHLVQFLRRRPDRVHQRETLPQETGTVLALYNVTLVSLIGILSAPVAGAAYDLFGARPLYAIALAGYALGWLSLWLTRQRQ